MSSGDLAEFDAVVIGGGAVGLIAAQQLAAAGRRVVVVEAGGAASRARSGIVDDVVWSGTRHDGSLSGWTTGLGGTTQLWGGQLWAWEDYEFAERPELGIAGWPVNRADLQPHYEQFLRSLRTTRSVRDRLLQVATPDLLSGGIYYTKYSAWLPWRRRNVYRTVGRALEATPHVAVLPDRQAVALEGLGGAKPTVQLRGHGGPERISAPLVVLAAGTLGNIRLLQASEASHLPWLGRGFMDHVSARYATFDVIDPGSFVRAAGAKYVGSSLFTPRHVMHPSFAREHGLVNAFAHWGLDLQADSPYAILRKMLRDIQGGAGARPERGDIHQLVRRGPRELAWALYCSLVLRRRPVPTHSKVHLYLDVEQPPRPDAKIEWMKQNGRETLHVEWMVGTEEADAFNMYGSHFFRSLDPDALGLRPSEGQAGGPPAWKDTYHMMGGTRMGKTPEDSVVDHRLALHGAPNVLVLGASVFPSGGVANPTMTAASLGLRSIEMAGGAA